jgi:hypothetical protein
MFLAIRQFYRLLAFGSATYQKEALLPCLLIIFIAIPFTHSDVYADVSNEEYLKEAPSSDQEGTRPTPMGLVLGLRAGAAYPYEKVLKNTGNGTSIGPLVNAEALYELREWIRLGMMLEWHQHSINLWGPKLGTLGVFSILPTVELRPDRSTRERLGWESFVNYDLGLQSLIPYVSLGLGANVHSFSNSNELTDRAESFSTTFALRVATGFDIALTSKWSFNTEVAWNRDSGTYKFNGQDADFNASSLNLLIGVRTQF